MTDGRCPAHVRCIQFLQAVSSVGGEGGGVQGEKRFCRLLPNSRMKPAMITSSRETNESGVG